MLTFIIFGSYENNIFALFIMLDKYCPMDIDYNMTSDELKKWRYNNGYSQSQLAKALGVITITISRWETGDRGIPSFLHLALKCLKKRGGEIRRGRPTVKKTKKERR